MTTLALNSYVSSAGLSARLVLGVPAAALVTAGLFWAMQSLIAVEDPPFVERAAAPNLELYSRISGTPDIIRRNRPPEQPDDIAAPPAPPRIAAPASSVPGEFGDDIWTYQPTADTTVIPTDVGFRRSGEAEPLVRIRPEYPMSAASRGLEGDCFVLFDVLPTGVTANIRADCSAAVFETAASRAIGGWRYLPQTVDGEPVVQRNLSVEMPFRLTE